MRFSEIQIGKHYWVILGEDDMYGAEDPSDNLVEVVVTEVNCVHLDIHAKHVDSDDDWILDPDQFYETKELAQQLMGTGD